MTFEAHASAKMVARVLDLEIVPVEGDACGRLTGPNLELALASATIDVCAVVATGGITNVGVVDDLAGVADVCAARELWFHVDAAYGGAALAVAETRPLFAGIERADSVVIDPHKWLFAPLDCSTLLYKEPAHARAAFTQHADYIAAFQEIGDWNPGDYGDPPDQAGPRPAILVHAGDVRDGRGLGGGQDEHRPGQGDRQADRAAARVDAC